MASSGALEEYAMSTKCGNFKRIQVAKVAEYDPPITTTLLLLNSGRDFWYAMKLAISSNASSVVSHLRFAVL